MMVTFSAMQAELRRLRQDLEARAARIVEEKIALALARLLLKTRLGATTSGPTKQTGDQSKNPLVHLAESFDNPEGGEPRQDEAEAIEAPGLAVVPVPRQPCWVINLGPKTAVLPTASATYRPEDLDQGEVCLYSLSSTQARIVLRKDGAVEITSGGLPRATVVLQKDGSVVLNGGTLRVARETDAVEATTLFATWMTAINTALTALGAANLPSPPSVIGAIVGSAAVKVKA